jgi:hypothetical protein
LNKVLVGEDIAEMEYQPRKCSRPYRLIIVRKNIMSYNGWLKDLFALWEHLRWLRAT